MTKRSLKNAGIFFSAAGGGFCGLLIWTYSLLLGILISCIFSFFAVACFALSTLMPEERKWSADSNVNRNQYSYSDKPRPVDPVNNAGTENSHSESQTENEAAVNMKKGRSAVPVKAGGGKVICPLCNTKQNEGRKFCFFCQAVFELETE